MALLAIEGCWGALGCRGVGWCSSALPAIGKCRGDVFVTRNGEVDDFMVTAVSVSITSGKGVLLLLDLDVDVVVRVCTIPTAATANPSP